MISLSQPLAIITQEEARKLVELIQEVNAESQDNAVYKRAHKLGLFKLMDELTSFSREGDE